MRITHNISALSAWRQLSATDNQLTKSLERLSSGLRINRAADDAAGLAISEKMRAQVAGLNQAIRNAQDSISLIQTAEGALNETHSILQRMRELAVQAASDTLTAEDREQIQKEIVQLSDELNRIGNTTEFNTKKLLDGSLDFVVATAAKVSGISVSGPITISGTPTSGYAQAGTAIADTGYSGSTPKDRPWVTTGSVDVVDILNNVPLDPVIDENANELTISYGGDQYEIVLNTAVVATIDDLVRELQIKIDAAIGANQVQVGYNSNNFLTFTAVNRGSDPNNKFEIVGGNFAAVALGNVTYTQGIDKGDVWVHGETDGYTTGSVSITDAALADPLILGPITIDADNNELTIRVFNATTQQWSEGTVTIIDQLNPNFPKTYNGTTFTREDLRNDVEQAIRSLGGDFDQIRVEFDVDNTLKVVAAGLGAGSQVLITGGNAMDELFGSTDQHIRYVGEAANNELTFELDGVAHTITLDNGFYNDAEAVVEQLNAQFATNNIAATASAVNGFIRITSNSTGVNSDVNNIGGNAAAELGFSTFTEVSGSDGNRTLTIEVDGELVNATLQEGTYTDLNVLAAAVQSAINTATANAADVSVNWDSESGTFSITSGSAGSASSIAVYTHETDDAAGALGLTGRSAVGIDEQNAYLTLHVGANKGQFMQVSISDVRSAALGISSTDSSVTSVFGNDVVYAATEAVDNNGTTEYVISVLDKDAANKAIAVLDNAISLVSSERSKLGALQNRLEHTITNLSVAAENLTAAESRIRDVDMAREMMAFVRNQILMQAGTAMLAQANMKPQAVLQLLG